MSWERVLSGPGLLNTRESLRDSGGEEPQWPAGAIRNGDPPDAIANAALDGRAELRARIARPRFGVCGAGTDDLALRALATGGVFLSGGIAPRIVPLLGASFRKAFLDKGRLSMLVEAAPVEGHP